MAFSVQASFCVEVTLGRSLQLNLGPGVLAVSDFAAPALKSTRDARMRGPVFEQMGSSNQWGKAHEAALAMRSQGWVIPRAHEKQIPQYRSRGRASHCLIF